MKIVFLAAEAFPFAKTGGLADVVGALPIPLRRLGHEIALIVPRHRASQALAGEPSPRPLGVKVRVPVGFRQVEGQVLVAEIPGSDVPIYLIEQPEYFDRPGIYGEDGADYPDNCQRFVFFQRAALQAIQQLDLRPDIVHCHDWHTGLIPVYLQECESSPGKLACQHVGTLLTIHNLAYQGTFPAESLYQTGLSRRFWTQDRLDSQGRLNFLKAGLLDADLLNTVSPTYAQEIQTPAEGRGLDRLLRARSADLRGIVNGIDREVWNPAIDPHLAARYDVETFATGKAICKQDLQKLAGLPDRPDVPLLAAIGRLDPQKGWNLLIASAENLLKRNVQMVILGTGDPSIEQSLAQLQDRFPGRVRAWLEFSDPLSHRIEAGADLYLMPSLYEPCGLNQLYSLAYGTVPVVRATGGLADTVNDASPENLKAGTANGFTFHLPETGDFQKAIDRAITLYRSDRSTWNRLIRSGMAEDWTWDRSAREYDQLYKEVRERHISSRASQSP